MPTVSVDAYGFAATFKLRDLLPVFQPGSQGEPILKERMSVSYGPGRWAFAYDFGAVVFVGIDPAEQRLKIGELQRRMEREPHPPTTESFMIESGGPALEVRFDRVVVPELTQAVADIVALIVAQSVAMDYYARDVREIESETDRITSYLQTTGRIPGPSHKLIKFIGLCIATRNDVLSTLALFDKPDATWESEALDRLWEGLYRMLELDDRYKALEAKLSMFQDNIMVLVDLTRGRQTLRLEAAVVLLILMEAAIMVWQVLAATGHAS